MKGQSCGENEIKEECGAVSHISLNQQLLIKRLDLPQLISYSERNRDVGLGCKRGTRQAELTSFIVITVRPMQMQVALPQMCAVCSCQSLQLLLIVTIPLLVINTG